MCNPIDAATRSTFARSRSGGSSKLSKGNGLRRWSLSKRLLYACHRRNACSAGMPPRALSDRATATGCRKTPTKCSLGSKACQPSISKSERGSLKPQCGNSRKLWMMDCARARSCGVQWTIPVGGLSQAKPRLRRMASCRSTISWFSRLPRVLCGFQELCPPSSSPACCSEPVKKLVPLRCMPTMTVTRPRAWAERIGSSRRRASLNLVSSVTGWLI